MRSLFPPSLLLCCALLLGTTSRLSAQAFPTVRILSPTNGQVYASSGTVPVTTAVTAFGNAQVDFFLQDVLVGSNAAPYSLTLDGLAPGMYTLFARVTDTYSQTASSESVEFIVNEAPTIVISTDGTNFFAQGTVMLSAEVTDDQELETNAVVRFFANGTEIGIAPAPFSFSWSNLAAGAFQLTAEVTDSDGESATSSPLGIVVEPNPVASIVSPADGAVFLPGTNVAIRVEATNVFGRAITSVTVFEGANVVGTATEAPFIVNWANATVGNYVITARATDDGGDVATTEPITISIVNFVISKPGNGALFFTNQLIEVEAEGVTAGLSNVVLFTGTEILLESDTPPFTASFLQESPGVIQIGVAATDSEGRTSTNTVSVTVLDRPESGFSSVSTNYGMGLLVQTVSITNPTSNEVSAARVLISDLPSNVQVYNQSGETDGYVYVQYNQAIPAGETVELDIEYYVPDLRPPNATLEVVLSALEPEVNPTGTEVGVAIKSSFNGVFYLEFQAAAGTNVYYVQYATNMASPFWRTAHPAVQTRRSNPVFWFDTGPPRTVRPPAVDVVRMYRVIQVTP